MVIKESKRKEVDLRKPERCHARGMMVWLSQYGKDGCPQYGGCSVHLEPTLMEERQAIWCKSSEGAANFRTKASSRRCV